MPNYPFILEKYKGMNTRYDCPACGKRKTFTRYIDTETGAHIAPHVGICNRINNCGYHYPPKQFFKAKNEEVTTKSERHTYHKNFYPSALTSSLLPVNAQGTLNSSLLPVNSIAPRLFADSLAAYNNNHFVTYLISLFGKDLTDILLAKYLIATSKHWPGATVFWQIDIQGKIRTGKIMLYNALTGKRVKEPYNHVSWVHTLLKTPGFNLQQCLFGEHLLKIYPDAPVGIVESEKTAIIASVYMPERIWLATGGIGNLNAAVCKVLQGRDVRLYPDLKAYKKWYDITRTLGFDVSVSDTLEKEVSADEHRSGFDLADYLITFSYTQFVPRYIPQPIEPIYIYRYK